MSSDGPQDLLSDVEGVRCWLATNDLADRCDADEKVRGALVAAREAILAVVEHRSADDFNAVLDRGRIRRTLAESGPRETAEVPQAEWLAGWLAADSLLSLLDEAPDRIKQCAHAQCILWFHDTSKNGARRWHSMAVCGNRAKAARHYAAKRD
jgi:predicted RNA-binding Zn ribbon-like protein